MVEGSRVLQEYCITEGNIQNGGGRGKPMIADYLPVNQGRKLAEIEAKSNEVAIGEAVAQAKNYAEKLHLDIHAIPKLYHIGYGFMSGDGIMPVSAIIETP